MKFKAWFHLAVADCERTVLPVVAVGDEIGAEGVGLDVLQCLEIVFAGLDGETFEAALVEMAGANCIVSDMPTLRVSCCDPLHEC